MIRATFPNNVNPWNFPYYPPIRNSNSLWTYIPLSHYRPDIPPLLFAAVSSSAPNGSIFRKANKTMYLFSPPALWLVPEEVRIPEWSIPDVRPTEKHPSRSHVNLPFWHVQSDVAPAHSPHCLWFLLYDNSPYVFPKYHPARQYTVSHNTSLYQIRCCRSHPDKGN